jgi:hypothetical protein
MIEQLNAELYPWKVILVRNSRLGISDIMYAILRLLTKKDGAKRHINFRHFGHFSAL